MRKLASEIRLIFMTVKSNFVEYEPAKSRVTIRLQKSGSGILSGEIDLEMLMLVLNLQPSLLQLGQRVSF